MQFDATSLSGQYTVIGEMYAVGLSWTKSIEFLNQTVVFSSFDFELTAAHDRSVEPGQTSQLTYSVKNTGVSVDSYTIAVSDVRGWVSSYLPRQRRQQPCRAPLCLRLRIRSCNGLAHRI